MVPMFAKNMDTVTEDLAESALGIKVANKSIPAPLLMDDLTSMAEGYKEEERTLKAIHNFVVKHKIE